MDIKDKLKAAQKLLTEIGEETELRFRELEEKEKAWNELQKKLEESWNKAKQKIKLDVGGKIFATSKEVLLKHKDTYFSALLGSGKWLPDEDGVYFIDRDPTYFNRIIDFLRNGELNTHGLDTHMLSKLHDDLDYFQIPIAPPTIDTHITFDLSRKSTKANISGKNLGFVGVGNWATVFGTAKGNILYWEIKVLSHQGAGHVRLGIAKYTANLEAYLGSQNSIAIYPGNYIEENCTTKISPNFSDSWTPGSTVIGCFFNRKKGIFAFYCDKKLVAKFDVPNAQDWFPAFCVHCSQDSISLIENPHPPQDVSSYM